MKEIITGSLEEIEGFNGFYLYGKDIGGDDVFVAQMGTEPLGYDPNDDPELELAYQFITV